MKKPDSLRAALTQAFPDEFASDAQRLSLWIEEGHVRCHAGANNLNYSIEYKLCIAIEGWRLPSLLIWIVVIDWLRVHQPELLTPAQSNKAIPFEADLISNVEVDIGFNLMLTEAVRVTRRVDGGFDMRVVDEPNALFPDAAPLLCSARCSSRSSRRVTSRAYHPRSPRHPGSLMTTGSDLDTIEPFLHELMDGLQPGPRKRLVEKIMRLARRANAQRIGANITPERAAMPRASMCATGSARRCSSGSASKAVCVSAPRSRMAS